MKDNDRGFLEDKTELMSASRDINRFVLSLVPYEETTTYIKGTRHGPQAIIEASGHIELLDETLRVDASRYGITTVRPDITDLKSITAHASALTAAHEGALLGFLGGEHSITPAIIEGLCATNKDKEIGIVWIDAHADLRSSYCGREDNHACAGLNSTPFGPIVQVGIRSLAEEEVKYLDETDTVKSFRHWNQEVHQAIEALPRMVYLSIDLDGFSPTLMRAVGTPEPGGLSWEEVVDIVNFVFAGKDVLAFDVVELCPLKGDVVSTYTAARLVYKVMAFHAHYKLKEK